MDQRLSDAFEAGFGQEPGIAWHSPGRVNLIGEHTDYHGGWVLPAAIDLGTRFLAAPNGSRRLRIRSLAFPDSFEIVLADLAGHAPRGDWSDYFVGVARQLLAGGEGCTGIDVLVDSNLPAGSGLSSSASITLGFACVLNDAWQLQHDTGELVTIAQRAENDFVGLQCGVLDPFAVAMGKRNHVIALRCSDMQWEHVPFPAASFSIVVANTGVPRTLANSPYNVRRRESGVAVETALRHSGCAAASELSVHDLEFLRSATEGQTAWRRARHVVTENARVQAAVSALKEEDMGAFGQALIESHRSLRDDYKASCTDLDTMVELALEHDACIGAKMTGAGFGGAAVAVVNAAAAGDFVAWLDPAYRAKSRHAPSFNVCGIGDGAGKIGFGSTPIEKGVT